MKITKNKILKSIPKRDEIFREAKSLEKEMIKLKKRFIDKTELLQAIDEVSMVVEGEPIKVWDICRTSFRLESSDPENNRVAEVYRNANNKRTFGLKIQEYWAKRGGSDHRWYGDKWCGAEWKRRKDAKAAAIAWVVHGTMPKFNGTSTLSEFP